MSPEPDPIRAAARRAANRLAAEASADASPPLVSADGLRDVPDGGTLRVPGGARITPLAREEAFRRGITVERGGAAGRRRRVAFGCDHGGHARKADALASLRELGVEVDDLGTHDAAPCDYPDFAGAVARAVADGRADLGVVMDTVGIGSAMAANKVPGVLAANCWDERTARSAREHNHANVLALGAAHLDRAGLHAVLAAFLGTPPGPGRHAARVAKIHALVHRPRAIDA